MGNAHAWRHRSGRGKPCPIGCVYCKFRPSQKRFRNKNGHRHNPSSNTKQRR